MSLTNTLPIVGAFYRPPAKAILDNLKIGAPLVLTAEPDNAYDPNAIAVWLKTETLAENSSPELEAAVEPFGFSLADIYQQEAWHLGYLPKEMAKVLRETGQVLDETEYGVSFSLSNGGQPRVRREEPFNI